MPFSGDSVSPHERMRLHHSRICFPKRITQVTKFPYDKSLLNRRVAGHRPGVPAFGIDRFHVRAQCACRNMQRSGYFLGRLTARQHSQHFTLPITQCACHSAAGCLVLAAQLPLPRRNECFRLRICRRAQPRQKITHTQHGHLDQPHTIRRRGVQQCPFAGTLTYLRWRE